MQQVAHFVIGIIGAGNMGKSLIGGLLQSGHPAESLWVADKNVLALQDLADTLKVQTTTHNAELAQFADVIILAIKPQSFVVVAKEISSIVKLRRPLIISIMAGVRICALARNLAGVDSDLAIVRAMPNTPSLIGAGAAALYANSYATDLIKNRAESILRTVGICLWVDDEDAINTVTALSGSGPAYFFLLMEILQNAGVALGLPLDTARLLTLQTALGAAKMALERLDTVSDLRKQVTSPGGTTEKALQVLHAANIEEVFLAAVSAAKLRAQELADLIE